MSFASQTARDRRARIAPHGAAAIINGRSAREEVARRLQLGHAGTGLRGRCRRAIGHCGHILKHVFGKHEHDRSRPAGGRDAERAVHELRNALDLLDLRNPFRERSQHSPVFDFLLRFTLEVVAGDLAHEHHQRRRVLERRMESDRVLGGLAYQARPAFP